MENMRPQLPLTGDQCFARKSVFSFPSQPVFARARKFETKRLALVPSRKFLTQAIACNPPSPGFLRIKVLR